MSLFYQSLNNRWRDRQSLVCVGLDPDLRKIPECVGGSEKPLLEFNKQIVDATAPYVCSFKPQIAYYAAIGAEDQLEETIQYIKSNYPDIPVILDAKRGDIGSTADMYAIEAFDRYMADAVTVNPYMGGDTILPFSKYQDKGVILLCRTSNPGSGDLQELIGGDLPIYQQVASLAANRWNENNNVGLVVGATYPEVLAEVRQIVGSMPILVPGIGAQGGDLAGVLSKGLDNRGLGLAINVSRSVIYASDGEDFAEAAGAEAQRLRDEINQYRNQ